MTPSEMGLPEWVLWRQRPFPDANLLLLQGAAPALVDSGFVGHAEQTADWVHAHTSDLHLVVNTHWPAPFVLPRERPAGCCILEPLRRSSVKARSAWDTVRRRDRAGSLSGNPV